MGCSLYLLSSDQKGYNPLNLLMEKYKIFGVAESRYESRCSRREIPPLRGAESHSDTLCGKQSYAVDFTLTRLEQEFLIAKKPISYFKSATPNFSLSNPLNLLMGFLLPSSSLLLPSLTLLTIKCIIKSLGFTLYLTSS